MKHIDHEQYPNQLFLLVSLLQKKICFNVEDFWQHCMKQNK